MSVRRRDLLTGGAAAAALAMLPPRAFASWGDAPVGSEDRLLGPGVRAERCLELFLFGGMPTFHSFYAVDDYGRADDPDPSLRNTQYHLFEDEKQAVWGSCGDHDPARWLVPFGTDGLGKTVNFTPIARPLLDRPDILARTRVVVLRHEFEPHEISIPFMLTGQRLGNPRLAGLGTHVQRYWNERGEGSRSVPYSFVLSPEGSSPTYNLAAASAVGAHPGAARPLHLFTSADTNIGELLGRRYLGEDRSRVDALLDYYAKRPTAQYIDRSGALLRSPALGDQQFAVASLIGAPSLQEVLGPEMFARPSSSVTCGSRNGSDVSTMALDAAVSLLTHPTSPARSVTVVDGGSPVYGELSYDLHENYLQGGTQNLRHLLRSLCAKINEPGEADPRKLDLDDTMILVNGEFGRTPYAQYTDPVAGTDHFPFGFVALLIGGPTEPGVAGALGRDGHAVEYLTPSEYRAGALAALGIHPFSAESFAVGDVRGASDEAEALEWLNQTVIGRTT